MCIYIYVCVYSIYIYIYIYICVCVCVCACECVSLSYICIKFLSPSRCCAAWPPAPTVHGRWAHQLLLRPTRCWQTAPCLEIRNPRADRGRSWQVVADQHMTNVGDLECKWNAVGMHLPMVLWSTWFSVLEPEPLDLPFSRLVKTAA